MENVSNVKWKWKQKTINREKEQQFILFLSSWCVCVFVSIDLDSRFVQFDHLHKNVFIDLCYWNYFNSCIIFVVSIFIENILSVICFVMIVQCPIVFVFYMFFPSDSVYHFSMGEWNGFTFVLYFAALAYRNKIKENLHFYRFYSERGLVSHFANKMKGKRKKKVENVTSIWLRLSMKFYSKIRHYKLLVTFSNAHRNTIFTD